MNAVGSGDLMLRLSAHSGMKCLNTKYAFVKSQKFLWISILCTHLGLRSGKSLKLCSDSIWIFPVIKGPRTGTLFIQTEAMFSDDLIRQKKKKAKYNNWIGSVFQNFPKTWKGC